MSNQTNKSESSLKRRHLLYYALAAAGYFVSVCSILLIPLVISVETNEHSAALYIAAGIFWAGLICGTVFCAATVRLRRLTEPKASGHPHAGAAFRMPGRRAMSWGLLLVSAVFILAVMIAKNVSGITPVILDLWLLFLSLEGVILHSGRNDKYTVLIFEKLAAFARRLWRR